MRIAPLLVLAACCPPAAPAPKIATVPPPVPAVVAAPPVDAAPAVLGPPVARVTTTVDKQFGIEVADPYRWMEGIDNAELKTWLSAQGEYAAKQLATLSGRDKLYARIRELGLGVTAVYGVQLGGARMFHYVFPAGAQLAKLAVREADGTTRILVDPEQLAKHVSLNAYSASPDGAYVAYVVSKGGGERGVLHIMDVKTGADLPEQIDRIWGEGAASWLPDSKQFFYTQLAEPQPGVDPMTNQIERLHVLGTPADKDPVILGRTPDATWKMAPEEWPGLWVAPGSTWVVAYSGGAHSETRVGVAKLSELDKSGASKTPWRIVAEYSDGIESAFPHGDRLYMKTYKDAPNRKLISVPLAKPMLSAARVEVAADPAARLEWVAAAKDALYISRQVNGLSRVERVAWSGGKPQPVALPYEGWAHDVASDMRRDGVVFQIEGWLRTGSYFSYDVKKKQLAATGLASSTNADVSQIVADEVEVVSADGAKVPLSIIHRKDIALDGSHPTLLYAYGGYGSIEHPGFSSSRVVWVERGGVYAIAHVRGGGEKGRQWQDDGSREHKLNGVHDFIACAEYLIAQKYTSPKELAIHGVSMGGVLVGRALTERPDLFAAAQLAVGIVNPLRILEAENGANQKTELGDPATESGYRSILDMDPYTHVNPGTAYPAVIFTIGLNDHRVAPWMTGKMAARLMASTTSKQPILVRVDADAGHGIGSTRDQGFAEKADVWAFFLSVMGEAP